MKKYNIYDMQTDEKIGEVEARTVTEAEIIASEKFNRYSNEIYALTK